MQWIIVLLVVAATFGCCYLLDKGFTRMFRNTDQHKSGLSVRPAKRYFLIGLGLCLLGIMAILSGISGNGKMLLYGGIAVLLFGGVVLAYYAGTGIYYNEDGFVVAALGKKNRTYRFSDITSQSLYLIQGGAISLELHLEQGGSISVNSVMEGMYPFLDHAFAAWCRQKEMEPENCEFHDPSQCVWFPVEGE